MEQPPPDGSGRPLGGQGRPWPWTHVWPERTPVPGQVGMAEGALKAPGGDQAEPSRPELLAAPAVFLFRC